MLVEVMFQIGEGYFELSDQFEEAYYGVFLYS